MSIADRVQERLHALQLNPAETARKAGLARTFVADLLHGKKKSIRHNALVELSRVLECDVDYLTEAQPHPRKPNRVAATSEEISIEGICEAEVWRSPTASLELARVPITPDPRFPGARHRAYIARGGGASKIGIDDGMIVIGVAPDGERARSGDLTGAPLVVRRTRSETGEIETSIRTIEATATGAVLSAPSSSPVPPVRFPAGKGEPSVEILAVIVRAVRFFGART